jgi:hypothetical protein
MYLTFTMPAIPPREVVAGIYKLTFDGKWFYFGSAINIRSRFYHWKHALSNGEYKNFRMAEACLVCSEIRMEIVEVVTDTNRLLERESYYLREHWGNPCLLNRAPVAGSNQGLKMEPWQMEKAKGLYMKLGQPLGKYQKDGTFVKRYESMADAIRADKLNRKQLSLVLRYSGYTAKGHVYRKLDAAGNPIVPPAPPNRLPKKRGPVSADTKRRMSDTQRKLRASDGYAPAHPKPMVRCDAAGNILERYRSFQYLAKQLGVNDRSLNTTLKKGRPGYYKGFFYRPE